MTKANSETTEKSISEQLAIIWAQLTRNQRRFVIASLEEPAKKEAALSIGLKPDTVYRWPDIVDEAIKLAGINAQETALDIIAQSSAKAAMVKVNGLDSDDEKIRQTVATEILDRVMGRAVQRQEITGKDGGPVIVVNWGNEQDTD